MPGSLAGSSNYSSTMTVRTPGSMSGDERPVFVQGRQAPRYYGDYFEEEKFIDSGCEETAFMPVPATAAATAAPGLVRQDSKQEKLTKAKKQQKLLKALQCILLFLCIFLFLLALLLLALFIVRRVTNNNDDDDTNNNTTATKTSTAFKLNNNDLNTELDALNEDFKKFLENPGETDLNWDKLDINKFLTEDMIINEAEKKDQVLEELKKLGIMLDITDPTPDTEDQDIVKELERAIAGDLDLAQLDNLQESLEQEAAQDGALTNETPEALEQLLAQFNDQVWKDIPEGELDIAGAGTTNEELQKILDSITSVQGENTVQKFENLIAAQLQDLNKLANR